MLKTYLTIFGLAVILFSSGCASIRSMAGLKPATTAPVADLDAPASPRDVTVELDRKQSSSGKISARGGSVSLKTSDGSTFKLEVPANAVASDTTVTMTAVKTLDGAPLDNNSPTAVQLEPSGLFFKEMATLTIVPSKEVPIKQQIAFGYEGEGTDYRLALVDPKSKDIKIKLMRFSGAGVGSGSDAAWAANLMIQARTAEDRIGNKLAEYVQETRRQIFTEGDDSIDNGEFAKRVQSYLDQLDDQVVRKEEAAAELDCKHATKAVEDLISVERQRQILGLPGSADFESRVAKIKKNGEKCRRSYRVDGVSGYGSPTLKGEICSLDKPFVIMNTYAVTGTWPLNFTPSSENGGQMEGHFADQGCTIVGGGPYTIKLNEDGSGTISWTYHTTSTCPVGSMSRTVTAELPLIPAPDISCP